MNERLIKIRFIIQILALIFLLRSKTYFGEEIIRQNYLNVTVYNSCEIDNKTRLNIGGLDLSKYKNIDFFKYIVIDENEIILLGKEKPRLKNILISIDLKHTNNEGIIKKYDWPNAIRINKIDMSLIKYKNKNEINRLLVVVYNEDASGNKIETSYTNIDVFIVNIEKEYLLIDNEQIEENNLVYSQEYDNPNVYYAHANIIDPGNQNKNYPAFKKINKIIFCDANNDGYEDILIWSKINLSRLMKDEDKEDFLFDNERIYVMYFDPENMKFKKMLPLDWN